MTQTEITISNLRFRLKCLECRVTELETTGGGGGAACCLELQDQINSINEQITDLQEQVDGIDLTTIESDIDNLETRVTDTETDIANIQNSLITSSIQGRVNQYADLPSAAANTGEYWAVTNTQGTKWAPGPILGTFYDSGIYYSDGVTWEHQGTFPYEATQIQVDAGLANDVFVTPLTLENADKWNDYYLASNPAGYLASYTETDPIWTADKPNYVTLTGSETLTNKTLTSGTNTFPTFNQNTTGSAATLTTSRNIQGVAFNGSANIDIINGTGLVKAAGTTLSYVSGTSSQFIKGDGSLDSLSYRETQRFLGIIYEKSTWSNLTDFTTNGATVSVVSNQLNFSGGAGTFTQTLDINRYTCLSKWTAVMNFTPTVKNSTSYGAGFGIRSVNANGGTYNLYCRIDCTNTGSSGLLIINAGSSNTQVATSSTNLTFSANHQLSLVINYDNGTVTFSALNLTVPANPVATVTYTYSLAYGATVYMPNTGRFAIGSYGGTFTVNSLKVESRDTYNAQLLTVGDSKVSGYYAGSISGRFSNLLADNFQTTVVNAGGNDVSASVLSRIQEIIDLSPQQVFLVIGSNDIRYGVSSATLISNYDSIVSQLVAAGIRVVHSTGIKETVLDQSALRTHILATYATADIIDTLPLTTISLTADNVHPNLLGNQTLYNFILSSYKINNGVDFLNATSFGRSVIVETSASTLKTTLSLNNVENTALSTWAGSTNITTLGTITSGTWNGTSISNTYITSVAWSKITSTPTTLSGYGITDAQPLDTDLTTIAGLTATTDNFIVSVASAWASRTPSQVRTTLGLVIGTNVQAWDADLDSIAALSTTSFGRGLLTESSASTLKTTLSLNNVENTALSTWAGTANITTVGTIASGIWNGTAIADAYISSAATWNAKQAALSGTGIVKSTAGTISYLTDNSTNWDTAYTNRITSLTTTGTSGAATLISNVLNIPQYSAGGGGGYAVTTVTAATHNETSTSGEVILLCDTTSNNITVNLPTAVGNSTKITIKRISAGSNTLTADGDTTETIDGGLTASLVVQYSSISIISDNTNWYII